MNIKHKIISLTIVLITVITVLLAWKYYYGNHQISKDGLIYEIENGEAIVIGYDSSPVDVVIPDNISIWPVTSIKTWCFAKTKIESVICGKNLTRIESCAFLWCEDLEKVELPENLLLIGGGAFNGCTKLQNIHLPEGVMINTEAFQYCYSLKDVTGGSHSRLGGVRVFRETPFLDERDDEFIVFGDGNLLAYNGDDEKIMIPEEVRVIRGVFEDTTCKTIYVPETVECFDDYSFTQEKNIEIVFQSSDKRYDDPRNSIMFAGRVLPENSSKTEKDALTIVSEYDSEMRMVAEEYRINWREITEDERKMFK